MSIVRRNIYYIFLCLIVAGLTCWALLYRMPYKLMEKEVDKYVAQAGGYNKFIHAPMADHNWNKFVRPLPDATYSIFAYDVSKDPLVFEIPPFDGYWVFQFVQENTDSYEYVGTRTIGNRGAKVILSGPNIGQFDIPEGSRHIASPTGTGIILARYLVKDKADLGRINQVRKSVKAYPL